MKQKINSSKSILSFLCIVLIVAMALTMTSCGKDGDISSNTENISSIASEISSTFITEIPSDEMVNSVVSYESIVLDEAIFEGTASNPISLGVGETKFKFVMVADNGVERHFIVNTNAKTVGEALLATGVIEGDYGDYGLYVKKVCGIAADYNVTKTYWAFYVNGEYATAGIDKTDIVPNATYMFKVEK